MRCMAYAQAAREIAPQDDSNIVYVDNVMSYFTFFFWGKTDREWIESTEYTIFMNKIHRIFMLLHIFFVIMQHEKGVFFLLIPFIYILYTQKT